MMGTKERDFRSLPDDISLEELVPKDNFYRRLEERLDLSFVRELVEDLYASSGRPGVDPVVFFKLELVLFFEDLRSERQLMRVVADRFSLRWYLGYDLNEPLPDHSSLTRIRERYGLGIFRGFFERIVEECFEAGLVWGEELFIDATKVEADAAVDSLAPRWFVEAYLQNLFEKEAGECGEKGVEDPSDTQDARPEDEELVRFLPMAGNEDLLRTNRASEDWISRDGAQIRTFKGTAPRERTADIRASRTDPDATPMRWSENARRLGYRTNYVVDGGKARIILSVLVTPGEVSENHPMLDLLWRTAFRWKLRPHHVTADGTYGTAENIEAVERSGIRAYLVPHEAGGRAGFFRKSEFAYDAEKDLYTCPVGQTLRALGDAEDIRRRGKIVTYRARASVCAACPLKPRCTTNKNGRSLRRSPKDEHIDIVSAYMRTEPYRKALRKRKVWIEPLFAEGKLWRGMSRFRTRMLKKVNAEALMTATGQNVKCLLAFGGGSRRSWRKRRHCGRWPDHSLTPPTADSGTIAENDAFNRRFSTRWSGSETRRPQSQNRGKRHGAESEPPARLLPYVAVQRTFLLRLGRTSRRMLTLI
jgi:transposase